MNCVVTGAGGGVGSALVNGLRSAGATVIAVYRGRSSSIMETRSGLYTVQCDLTNENAVQSLVHDISVTIGPIHAWVNTAGGFHSGESIEESSMDVWRQMFSINFITALNCSRAVLPGMKQNRFGRIINFGSFPGEEGLAQAAPYAISKAAVHILTKTIWLEGHKAGVSAHVIIPTTIDTPTNREAMPDDDWSNWVTTKDISDKIIEIITTSGIERDPAQIIILIRGSGASVPVQKTPGLLDIFDSNKPPAKHIEKTAFTAPEPVATPEPVSEPEEISEEADSTTEEVELPVEPGDAIAFDTEDWEPKEPEPTTDEEVDIPDEKAEEPSAEPDDSLKVETPEETVPDIIQKIREGAESEEAEKTVDLDLNELAPKEPESTEEKPISGLSDAIQQAGKRLQDIFKRSDTAPALDEDTVEESDESKDQINPDMASFEMVEHLKIRQQYDKALAMLAIMEENGAPIDRVQEERNEIHELIYPLDRDIEDEAEDSAVEASGNDDSDEKKPDDSASDDDEDMDLAGYLDRIALENKKEKEAAPSPEDKKKK
ncbi:MAG: SDR family NAD(P)-dependent oxidoreductase, partial [Simkaniaceae bacterium]|nr:SDR family NAD(P)-dependent oxidoreductase [Simkaniaceae bacterium]